MTIAQTNRVALRYARESVWGETPQTPAATALRITAESLAHRKRTALSREIRADRQRTALLETGQGADGDVSFELAFGVFDSFLEAALGDAVASALVQGTELTFGPSTIAASTAASTVWEGFSIGQAVRVTGAGQAANNAVVAVEDIAANVLTFTGATGTAETTGAASVQGRMIRNGTQAFSYFLEADFTDITAVKYFTGMTVDRLRLDIAAERMVTGVFSFLGRRGFAASATVASAVVAAPAATVPLSGADVIAFSAGGGAIPVRAQSLTLSLANNGRAQAALASKPAVGVGAGSLVVTGTMQAFFETLALYQAFVDHAPTSLSLRLEDTSGNALRITLPRIQATAGNPEATAIDADVFVPLEFTAVRDPATGCTIQLDLLPASP